MWKTSEEKRGSLSRPGWRGWLKRRGEGAEVGRSRRLNREEIECSSNIEEDSPGSYPSIRPSVRPLSDSSSVHRLPPTTCGVRPGILIRRERGTELRPLLPPSSPPCHSSRADGTSSRKFYPPSSGFAAFHRTFTLLLPRVHRFRSRLQLEEIKSRRDFHSIDFNDRSFAN